MVVTYIYGYLQYMVAAELEIWRLQWRFDDSSGDMVAPVEIWWLQWRYGGYRGDMVATVEI